MNRLYSIDFFKSFAALSVIYLHLFDRLEISSEFWILIDSASRFAVPLFFTSSGYLICSKINSGYYKKKYTGTRYIRKYIYSILKVWVTWSVIDIIIYNIKPIINSILGKGKFLDIGNLGYIRLSTFLNGDETGVLWYLICLVWAVIIVYILYRIIKIEYVVMVSFILHIIGLFGKGQIYSSSEVISFLNTIVTRDSIFFGLFYVSLGFYLYLKKDKIKNFKIGNITLILIIVLISLISYFQVSYVYKNIQYNLPMDYLPLTWIVNIALFILIIKNRSLGERCVLTKFGKDSLGIYIMHGYFIMIISKIMPSIFYEPINLFISGLYIYILSFYSYKFIVYMKDNIARLMMKMLNLNTCVIKLVNKRVM